MLTRHVFSSSVAYLMSGNETHLRSPDEAVDFLIEHGWDQKDGGYVDALNRDGTIQADHKDVSP